MNKTFVWFSSMNSASRKGFRCTAQDGPMLFVSSTVYIVDSMYKMYMEPHMLQTLGWPPNQTLVLKVLSFLGRRATVWVAEFWLSGLYLAELWMRSSRVCE